MWMNLCTYHKIEIVLFYIHSKICELRYWVIKIIFLMAGREGGREGGRERGRGGMEGGREGRRDEGEGGREGEYVIAAIVLTEQHLCLYTYSCYTYTHTRTRTYTCAHTHTYTHTHTHTHQSGTSTQVSSQCAYIQHIVHTTILNKVNEL